MWSPQPCFSSLHRGEEKHGGATAIALNSTQNQNYSPRLSSRYLEPHPLPKVRHATATTRNQKGLDNAKSFSETLTPALDQTQWQTEVKNRRLCPAGRSPVAKVVF